MIQAAVVSFIAAFALGSGAMWMLPDKQTPQAIATEETTSSEIISPLSDAEAQGEHAASIEPSPTPSTEPSPTPTPKPSPSPTLKPTVTPKPSPTPSPVIAAATGAQLDEWFTKYAGSQSINRDLLRNIAYCESKFNQFAKNGDYLGLYQFSSSTWVTTRRSMNQNPDPTLRTDAEEAIKTAAFRIATIGHAAWPNCSKI